MCKAALERFSTGPAAELCDDGIVVSALSPSALLLCTRPVAEVSGRVAYSQELLREFGVPRPGAGTASRA